MKTVQKPESIKDPPVSRNAEGDLRKVGVEIEYSGIDLATSCQIVKGLLGGQAQEHNPYAYTIEGTAFGTVKIEFDTSLLKNERYKSLLAKLGVSLDESLEKRFEQGLEHLLSGIVPCELVTDPMPYTELALFSELFALLRQNGAKGTTHSWKYAFGLHLNIELPEVTIDEVLSVLRAFLMLDRQLKKGHAVNTTRRLSKMISDFPESYRQLVLNPGYRPTREEFLKDYLEHNPTRERPLDLLPILCLWDFGKVEQKVEESHLLSARPAYHYRFPNSCIDDPGWTLGQEWERWLTVERLAHHRDFEDENYIQQLMAELMGKKGDPSV